MTGDATPRPYGTRAEHLAWAKRRALEYLALHDVGQAVASFASDLGKHDELAGAQKVFGQLMAGFLLAGLLDEHQARKLIEGTN